MPYTNVFFSTPAGVDDKEFENMVNSTNIKIFQDNPLINMLTNYSRYEHDFDGYEFVEGDEYIKKAYEDCDIFIFPKQYLNDPECQKDLNAVINRNDDKQIICITWYGSDEDRPCLNMRVCTGLSKSMDNICK